MTDEKRGKRLHQRVRIVALSLANYLLSSSRYIETKINTSAKRHIGT